MRLIVGDIYQGRRLYALEKYGQDIKLYCGLMDQIKDLIETGRDEEAILDEILKKAPYYDVVIAEEAFAGLTPIDKDERRLTEIYGRVLNALALKAVSVERVVCGLAISLK